jgi:hypothetical protein
MLLHCKSHVPRVWRIPWLGSSSSEPLNCGSAVAATLPCFSPFYRPGDYFDSELAAGSRKLATRCLRPARLLGQGRYCRLVTGSAPILDERCWTAVQEVLSIMFVSIILALGNWDLPVTCFLFCVCVRCRVLVS